MLGQKMRYRWRKLVDTAETNRPKEIHLAVAEFLIFTKLV